MLNISAYKVSYLLSRMSHSFNRAYLRSTIGTSKVRRTKKPKVGTQIPDWLVPWNPNLLIWATLSANNRSEWTLQLWQVHSKLPTLYQGFNSSSGAGNDLGTS